MNPHQVKLIDDLRKLQDFWADNFTVNGVIIRMKGFIRQHKLPVHVEVIAGVPTIKDNV